MTKDYEINVEDLDLLEGDEDEDEEELDEVGDQTGSVGAIEEEGSTSYDKMPLDYLVSQVEKVATQRNIDTKTVRFKLVEEHGEAVAQVYGLKFGDVLFSCKEEDTGYKSFLKNVVNISDTVFEQSLANAPFKEDYYNILKQTLFTLGKDLTSMEIAPAVAPPPPPPPVPVAPPPPRKERSIEVQGAYMKIRDVYKKLYTSGFDLVRPYGLLTSEGALTDGNGQGVTKVIKESLFLALYDIVNSLANKPVDDYKPEEGKTMSEVRNVTIVESKNYYPMYQLGHLYGNLGSKQYSTWTEVERDLEPMLEDVLTKHYEGGGNMNFLINALTTSMIITQFDMTQIIKLKCYIGGENINQRKFLESYESRKNEIMSGVGKIFRISVTDGVLEVTIMLDEDKYMSTPLFAYQAIEKLNERGIKPSTNKIILGQDINGNIVTENLDIGARSIVHISAGTRSGKGVVTLNLLGTFLASGNPVIYLDCKPDMASLLQEMGKKYNKRVAAYDVRTNYGFVTGLNIPSELQYRERLHGTIMYTKVLQLMLVLDSLRKQGFSYDGDKRPFFIFDEAISYQNDLASEWKGLAKLAEDKKDNSELAQWARKFGEWYMKLNSDSDSAILSELPKGGISSVWLFQKIQDGAWKKGDITLGKDKGNIGFNFVRTGSVFKLMGAGLDNSQYGLSKVNEEVDVKQYVNRKARHFALSEASITLPGQYKVIKPYLVLNYADMGSDVIHELRGNLGEAMFDKLLQSDNTVHTGVGFEGFANMIGSDALNNLDQGYNLLWEMIKFMGLDSKYSNVEEYIYDCDIESFHTVEELKNMAKNGGSDDVGSEVAVFSHTPVIEDNPTGLGGQEPDELEPQGTQNNDTLLNQYRQNQQSIIGDEEEVNEEDIVESGGSVGDDPPWGSNTVKPPWGSEEVEQVATQAETIDPFANHNVEGETVVTQIPQQEFVIPQGDLWGEERVVNQQDQVAREQVSAVPTEDPNVIKEGRPVYKELVKFDTNPFTKFKSNGLIATVGYMRETTDMLLKQMTNMVGSLDRIESLEVTGNGFIINGVPFRPRFEQDVLEAMPYLTRQQVERGNVIDLFDFKHLKKFKGIVVLIIDNTLLAEGRIRKEYGLARKPWTVLFERHQYLQEIEIGGIRITDEQEEEYYDNTARQGYEFKTTIAEKLGRSRQVFASSPIQNVWNAKPTKAITKAVGWTAGVKVASMLALALGPWGLVFGSIAAYSALKGRKNKNNRDE